MLLSLNFTALNRFEKKNKTKHVYQLIIADKVITDSYFYFKTLFAGGTLFKKKILKLN